MKRACTLAVLLALSMPAAAAQLRPQSGPGDPHLQSIDYDATQIVQLFGAPGYQMTVELSPDEQIQNVSIGDPAAWQVSVNHAGDHLFIKPVQAEVPTNMTVITTVRVYNFDLYALSGPASDMPYHVTFRYPAAAVQQNSEAQYVDVSKLKRAKSRFKVSGDRILRPDSITHDGEHTYVIWSADKPIPAVFQIDDSGQETLVNGAMRDHVYVIDAVPARLTFRIDRRVARAVRLAPRRTR